MSQFNAHQHSEGSFLDGLARVNDVMARAKECGHEYVTITDHGECNQQLAAAKAAAAAGLRFIPGIESYWMHSEDLEWHRTEKKQPHPSHICLLAMTNKGLSNLWALSSIAYDEKHHYYKPIATPDLMREYSEGIYASDGCMLTAFANCIDDGREDEARSILGTLLDIYRERFYIELHTWQYVDDDKPEHMALNARMRRLNAAKYRFAQELSVPFVIVNDSHHAYPEQWVNKELVWAFNTSKDNDKLQTALGEMAQKADHIMADDELVYWMGRHGFDAGVVAEGIRNSDEIAQHCEVEIKPTLGMPAMAESEHDDLANLIHACEVGFKKYVTDEGLDEGRYYARLQEELSLIAAKRFAGYFNVVRDYTMAYRSGAWSQYVLKGAVKDPMLVGAGRGSVGGSLVGYLTGIDIIDPLKYGTLFSRFLTPERKSLPDIDLDVPQSQRPDALKYFRARFGEGNVCAIGTISRNGPKKTVKDLGRAFGITKLPGGYADLDAINEHIEEVERMKDPHNPDESELTWEELIERKGGALVPYRAKYPQLFAKIEEMVGLARHAGVHASGILISSTPLLGTAPTRRTNDKRIATQFDMWEIEELGGVKFDLLGIRHLDTLSVARRLIYERHGVWIDYDRTGLSVPKGCTNVLRFGDEQYRDPAIWGQIDKGHTTGIFQVETSNCTSTAVDFHPRSEVDVADLTSVIRPGVVDAGLLQPYLRRRAGLEPVAYDHPLMEKFVGPEWSTNTHGILVYQEQFIQCVEQLAGFSPDESDDLRKAVGKKQMDKLMDLKSKFMNGCFDNREFSKYFTGPPQQAMDATEAVAHKIWESIEASGRYAFNWSHAVGYAMIATWEIWTKFYYPQEFLVALMQTDSDNINKYIREARRRGLVILPPDINKSERKFTIEGEAIRYGLDTVRGVGKAVCNLIMARRPFNCLEDLLKYERTIGKTGVVNLIMIGAFDEIAPRAEILSRLERHRILDQTVAPNKLQKLSEAERDEIWADKRVRLPQWAIEIPDFSDPQVLYGIEKELVGTYVTVDPMGRYVSLLDKAAIREPTDVSTFARGQYFVIGGQIAGIRPTVTKKGRTPGAEMAHITVTWNEADFRIVCFPESWRNCKDMLYEGAPVACHVKRLDSGCALETVERLDLLFDREGIA